MRSPNSMTSPSTGARPTTQEIEIPQYSRRMVLAVWAAAALPMAVLAWVVGPAVAGDGASKDRFFVTLLCRVDARSAVAGDPRGDPADARAQRRPVVDQRPGPAVAAGPAHRHATRRTALVVGPAVRAGACGDGHGTVRTDAAGGPKLRALPRVRRGPGVVPPQLVAVRAVRVRARHSTPLWARNCSSAASCSPGWAVPSAARTGSSTASCSASTTCTSHG